MYQSSSSEGIYDIFVSYAAVNNDLPAPFDGWISHFVDALTRMLRAKLGRDDIKIYFDLRTIEANQPLSAITDACKNATIFLAVSSPAYHMRNWTRHELENFLTSCNDPRRLFVIELEPFPLDEQLLGLRDRHQMRFHRPPSKGHAPIPVAPSSELFFELISDLSESICKQLNRPHQLQSSQLPLPTSDPRLNLQQKNGSTLRPVILAQVADDLYEEREAVRRYLTHFHIPVLPTYEYPQEGRAFEAAFAKDLGECSLVVQLLGANQGGALQGLRTSFERHQMMATKAAGVTLMQWRRSDLNVEEITDHAQRELLLGENVTASTLEQFKSDVLATLLKPSEPSQEPTEFLVFLNAERADRQTAKDMGNALAQHCSVALPLDDAPGSTQSDFNYKLRHCDGVVLLNRDAGPSWINAQIRHLKKVRAGNMPASVMCNSEHAPRIKVQFPMRAVDEFACKTDAGEWDMEPIRKILMKAKS